MTVVNSPIDPLEGPKLVLAGRVVTMNDHREVIPHGRVFIEKIDTSTGQTVAWWCE